MTYQSYKVDIENIYKNNMKSKDIFLHKVDISPYIPMRNYIIENSRYQLFIRQDEFFLIIFDNIPLDIILKEINNFEYEKKLKVAKKIFKNIDKSAEVDFNYIREMMSIPSNKETVNRTSSVKIKELSSELLMNAKIIPKRERITITLGEVFSVIKIDGIISFLAIEDKLNDRMFATFSRNAIEEYIKNQRKYKNV